MSEDYLRPYTRVRRGRKAGYVLAAEAAAVTAALFDPDPLETGEIGGRGRIDRFSLNEGEGIVRRYRRGGAVARLLGDRYLANRMLDEFRLTARLHTAGAAVPEPLGVVWERRGVWYRGGLATRAFQGETLHACLDRGGVDPVLLRECGRRIRDLHDAGLWHADLHVKNILVNGDAIRIIDLDNARLGRALSRIARARNLLRLRRSLEKHGHSLDNFTTICEGYGKLGLPVWLVSLYRFRGMVSDALQK